MTFNYQAAIQAGYTPDEINAYLAKNGGNQQAQSIQQTAPQQNTGGNWLSNVLGAAHGLGAGAVQDILAPLYLAGQKVIHGQNPTGYGPGQATPQQMQQYSQNNPFASKQQLQQMGGTPQHAAVQAGQDLAGATSWLVPFGRGASIATKALLPGLASGTLMGASQPNATPQSVGESAVAGAVVPGALGLGGKAINGMGYVAGKLGEAADNTSNALLRGQYNVGVTDSRQLGLPEATQELFNKYGISNKDTAVNIANQLTGKNGFYSNLVNQAIKQLPSTQLSGIVGHAQDLLDQATALDDTRAGKVLNNIKRAINVANDGTNVIDANPQTAMQSMRNLESLAQQNLNAKNPSEQALQEAGVYRNVAHAIEDRLFNGYTDPETNQIYPGANNLFMKNLKTPQILNQAYAIHPQVGMDFENNIHTLRDLRSAQAPFVSVSKAAEQANEAKMHSTGPSTMQTIGAGYLGSTVGWPAAVAALLGRPVLNSNLSKSVLANGFSKTGNALNKGAAVGSAPMNPLLMNLLLNAGSKTGSITTNVANQP